MDGVSSWYPASPLLSWHDGRNWACCRAFEAERMHFPTTPPQERILGGGVWGEVEEKVSQKRSQGSWSSRTLKTSIRAVEGLGQIKRLTEIPIQKSQISIRKCISPSYCKTETLVPLQSLKFSQLHAFGF